MTTNIRTLEASVLEGPADGIEFDDMSLAHTWEPTPDEIEILHAIERDSDMADRVFAAIRAANFESADDEFNGTDLADGGYDTEAFDYEALWVS